MVPLFDQPDVHLPKRFFANDPVKVLPGFGSCSLQKASFACLPLACGWGIFSRYTVIRINP